MLGYHKAGAAARYTTSGTVNLFRRDNNMVFVNRWYGFLFVFVVLVLPASADDATQCLEHSIAGDYQSAYPICKRAAEQGVADAQYILGLMYYKGEGVVQDKVEAARWYRQAGEQGAASAQYNLGLMYENGFGVEQDKVEAARWYREAGELGHAGAQYNLGLMYYKGEGVIEDLQEAYIWLLLAEINGYEEVVGQVKETVEQELSTSERRTATKEANRRQKKIRAY